MKITAGETLRALPGVPSTLDALPGVTPESGPWL